MKTIALCNTICNECSRLFSNQGTFGKKLVQLI